MKRPVDIAIDNGYYDHKVAYWDGDTIKTFKYPAIIGSDHEAMNSFDGKLVGMYESDGVRLVVDPTVIGKIPLRFEEYGSSRENRVLVGHGLHKAGIRDAHEVHLTTALPFRDFYNTDGSLNRRLIDAQKTNMMQPVSLVTARDVPGKRIATVSQSRVMSEGVAAVIDHLVRDSSGVVRQMRAPIAVLDFGGSTFDVVTVMPSMNIRQSSSDTMKRGTYDIRQNFEPMLVQYLQEMGVKIKHAPSWMVTEAFEKGYIEIPTSSGDEDPRVIPVTKLIEEAAKPTVNEVKKFVQQKLPNMAEYEAVILCGGGGLLCESLFEDWKDEYNLLVKDEFANVRGMLKMGLIA